MSIQTRCALVRFGVVSAIGTLASLSSLCVATAAEQTPQLRYLVRVGQVVAYRVEVTADRSDEIDEMKGVVSYTVKEADDTQVKVTYQGGLSRTQRAKPGVSTRPSFPPFGPPRMGRPPMIPGPPGLFGGAALRGLAPTVNQIVLTPLGEIQSMEGDSQLPYLLGNLSLLVFEPLPETPRTSWSLDSGVTITEKNEGGGGPPFSRGPMRFGQGPWGADPDKQTSGSEKTSFRITNDDGNRITAEKRYELDSPALDGEKLSLSGQGTWVFNRVLGLPESLDFKQQLTVKEGNTTVVVPIAIKYQRLSESEWKDHQAQEAKRAEEARQRLAELQRQQQETPLTSRERQDLLDSLRSDNTARVLSALQRLQMKTPKQPDAEIGAAVAAVRNHENSLVRQLAEKAAAQWPGGGEGAPGSAGVAATPGDFRAWTDDTGLHKVEAKFLRLEDSSVVLLRKDGREVRVPLDRLSPADQETARVMDRQQRRKQNPFEG